MAQTTELMGKIITLAGVKGGSGKSTITFHVATELLARGFKVGVLDIDPKLNNYYLCQRREEVKYWAENGELPKEAKFFRDAHIEIMPSKVRKRLLKQSIELPEYQGGVGSDLKDVVDAMRSRADFLIIDTGGGDSKNSRRAINYSDIVILPFLPSILDIDTLPDTMDVIEEILASGSKLNVKALINEKPTHVGDFRSKQLALAIKEFPLLENNFNVRFDHIYAYRDSLSYGLGVSDWTNPKAKGQVSYLVEEIIREVTEDNSDDE